MVILTSVFFIYSIGLLPCIFTFKLFLSILDLSETLHLFLFAFILFFEFLLLIFSEIVITAFIIRVFRIRYDEGFFDMSLEDNTYFKFILFSSLYLPLAKLIKLLTMEPLYFLYLRFLGVKIGKNTILVGRLNDPCLIEIGDNCVIGGHSIISAHAGEKQLILKKVKIGNNCIVGGWAHIMPGVIMQDSSKLGARSLALKNQVLLKGKMYGGIPAKEIKRRDKN